MLGADYFRYWFGCIVSMSGLIASHDALARTWIQRDWTITSAHTPDELFEQLLGDLHLEKHVQLFANELRQLGAFEAMGVFKDAAVHMWDAIEKDNRLEDPATLLSSPEWASLRAAASCVVALPAAQADGHREGSSSP
jgi:hypothetical protein